jgi:anti-sigma regulatory factor (Ser/Thr protein kinase)
MDHLDDLIQFVSHFAQNAGFNKTRIKEIELATEEAVVNIISYAYPDKTEEIEILCDNEKDAGLVIRIMDTGMPFDPLSLPEPDIKAHLSQRKIGGLGITLMRKMVDEISYRREEDANILTFVIHNELFEK